jgi:predicted metal-dependent hydrolase
MGMERSEVQYGHTRIAYEVARTRRQKTVAIAVDAHGRVEIKAPPGTPLERIDLIVHQKARWIVERQKQRRREDAAPPARRFVSGESCRYLGRQYRIAVRGGEEARVRLERGWLVTTLAPDAWAAPADVRADAVRASLIDWYRAHAAERLPACAAAWAPRLGVAPAEVLVRAQDRRWGSCDARGVLRLNWRIVQAPARLQEYVIVHELAHMVERDHSAAFWSRVGRALPDYDQRRAARARLGPELVW